jgi:predicted  nucleic acid-binding Zn-ribbon protein
VEVITEAERQGATLDAKRSRLDAQLRTVSNERQADALTHEIATLVQQHSELDDRELAAMEAQAEAEAALEELTSNRDRLAAAVDEATADLERALGRIAAEEAEVNRRRPDAVAALTDAELALYTTLRTRFGGVGITQLEGRRCGGCHLDLSATEADQVHRAPADELPECPHCGRLIVR